MFGLQRVLQYSISASLLSFAAAALFAPDAVVALGARNEFREGHALPVLAVGALGAHAVAAGLFAGCIRFKSWTFAGLAASLAPILVADLWLFAKAGAFNGLILAHAGLLVIVATLCVFGLGASRKAEIPAAQTL